MAQHTGTARTIIITDDEHRAELRETVKLARRGGGRVAVFLTPSALYEDRRVGALEAAYERYVEFEQFRQELASVPSVSAFEVGPADRLQQVLAAGRQRRAAR